MLASLSVKNFALLQNIDLKFDSGLTVITGETGAGKSILLGALGLLSGNRAETAALFDKSKKCIVEAEFNISGYKLQGFFETNDLDYSDLTTIRREINPNGNSRAFINDTPVTLAQLKELSSGLIDIHSQHQTLLLNQSSFQLSVIDSFAGTATELSNYQLKFKSYNSIKKHLQDLKEQEDKLKKEQDFIQFQFKELEEANLSSHEELEALEQEQQLLENAEEIKEGLNKCGYSVSEGEVNILSALAEVKSTLSGLSRFNPEIEKILVRINSSYIELKDIAFEISDFQEKVVFDPKRLDEVTSRLDLLNRLLKKHSVTSVSNLIELRDEFSNKIQVIDSFDETIKKLEADLISAERQLAESSRVLSDKRTASANKLEKQIKIILTDLGMKDATVEINFQKASFTANGSDEVKFLFSANLGSEAKEISKIASGGELSRVMLAIKSILAKTKSLPTIVFDEIDTGVSGEVADKIGKIMESMGEKIQVFTVTHLPQMASKGESHLFVYKQTANGKTETQIKALTEEQRVVEIAKMLSSGEPSVAAINNAKELLTN